MKKSVNLIFQVHQPYKLRKYRFFDIGNDHYYYDDFANETSIENLARHCYLPATSMLLRRIVQSNGKFKVAFFISGITLELFQKYAPSVIESFKALAETGHVEFLGGTWSNSLAAIKNNEAFADQVHRQEQIVMELFGKQPVTFYPTELIYSDDIGAELNEMGYSSAIIDGSKQILGWRNPEMLCSNAVYPGFKLHARHPGYSEEITDCPNGTDNRLKSPDEMVARMAQNGGGSQEINLCLDLEVFGAGVSNEKRIFTFLEAFITAVNNSADIMFSNPGISTMQYPPASVISVPYPVARDISGKSIASFTGNELQSEALDKIYGITRQILSCNNNSLTIDWLRLLACEHFFHMSGQHYAGAFENSPAIYSTPHESFLNYMHIFSDLKLRLDKCCPTGTPEDKIARLEALVQSQKDEMSQVKRELANLRRQKNNLLGN